MDYTLNILPVSEYSRLSELAQRVSLDEPIDFNCEFMAAKDSKNNILGVCGVNFKQANLPRLEHIIVDKPYQKKIMTARLLKEMTKHMVDKGYVLCSAFILNSKWWMQRYAEKFGFVVWEKKDNGNWYLKKIGA